MDCYLVDIDWISEALGENMIFEFWNDDTKLVNGDTTLFDYLGKVGKFQILVGKFQILD